MFSDIQPQYFQGIHGLLYREIYSRVLRRLFFLDLPARFEGDGLFQRASLGEAWFDAGHLNQSNGKLVRADRFAIEMERFFVQDL